MKEKGFNGTTKELYTLSKLYDKKSDTSETFTFTEDKSESVTTDIFCEQPNFIADGVYYPLGSDLYGYKISEIKNKTNARYKAYTDIISPLDMSTLDTNALMVGIPFTFEGVIPCDEYIPNYIWFSEGKDSWEDRWHCYGGSLTFSQVNCDNIYNATDCLELSNVNKNTYFEFAVSSREEGVLYTFSCYMRLTGKQTSATMCWLEYPVEYSYEQKGSDCLKKTFTISNEWSRYYYTTDAGSSSKVVLATNVMNLSNNNVYNGLNIKICGVSVNKGYPLIYNSYKQEKILFCSTAKYGKDGCYNKFYLTGTMQNYINKGTPISIVVDRTEGFYVDDIVLCPCKLLSDTTYRYYYFKMKITSITGTTITGVGIDYFSKSRGYPVAISIPEYIDSYTIVYTRRFPTKWAVDLEKTYDSIGTSFIPKSLNYYNVIKQIDSDYITEKRVVVCSSKNVTTLTRKVKVYSSLVEDVVEESVISSKRLYLGYWYPKKVYGNIATYKDVIIYDRALTEDEIKSTLNECFSLSIENDKTLLKHANIMETKI